MINYVTMFTRLSSAQNNSVNTESGTILKVVNDHFTKVELFSKSQHGTLQKWNYSESPHRGLWKVELFQNY